MRIVSFSRVLGLMVGGAAAVLACSGTPGGEPGFASGDDAATGSGQGGSSSGGGSGGGSSSSAASSSSSSSSTSSSSGGGGGSSGSSGGSSSGRGGSDAGGSASGSSSSGSSSGSSGSSGSSSSGSSSGPSDAAGAPDGCAVSDPDSAYFQQYNLMLLNMYRAMQNLPPYTLDAQLSAFALAGSQELSMDHLPHQHFINAGNTIWTMGFNTQAGENQGDPNGWRVLNASCPATNEQLQIAAILQAMFNEGPGTGEAHGHYENIMSTTFTRVGVGLVEVNNMLYLTNDFSN